MHPSLTADDVVDPTRLDGATAQAVVTELIMIYDADGGLRGELAYGWGKLRRTKIRNKTVKVVINL